MKPILALVLLTAVSAQAGVYRHALKPAAKLSSKALKASAHASQKAVKASAKGLKALAY